MLVAAVAMLAASASGIAREARGSGLLGRHPAERLTPSRWVITVSQRSATQARDIALYRAAILARATGHGYVQLVSFQAQGIDYVYGGYAWRSTSLIRTVFVQIEAVDDPAAPLRCEASVQGSPLCMMAPVEEILTEFAPRLGVTREGIEDDVAVARLFAARHPAP